MRVGIVGLGLIGGSMGLALKDMKLVEKRVGYDINRQNELDAINLGIVDEMASFDEIKKCDVVFLAIPVEAIIQTLQDMQDIPKTTTIIDLGSTKKRIIQSCPISIKGNLIAAHPMAGTENSGPKFAMKDLLKEAVVVICEDNDTDKFHLKKAVELLSNAGMRITFMDAKSHDHHVSFISHLPHVISFSLVNSVLKEENTKNIINLANRSFGDMSRISKSSPIMWVDIFKQNKDNVLNAVDHFKKELEIGTNLIKEEKWDELKEWITNARKIRDIL
ncbi:MAG: prephenate dehydrogenase [Campylobacter sp.]|nr:prephenate dehydrogenase [Campylobacter sp.]